MKGAQDLLFQDGTSSLGGDKAKEGIGGKESETPWNTLSLFQLLLFSEKRPLAGFTFELFTTFSQIIHPFQDFRIRSLVTM